MNYLKPLIIVFLFCFCVSQVDAIEKAHLRWLRKKPLIDSIVINIDGGSTFSKSEIKNRMYSREQSLWRKIKKDRRIKVQRESLGRDTLEIKYLYLTKGYLNIQVSETFHPLPKFQARNDKDKIDSIAMAMIWVNIQEGRKFQYGKMSLKGEYEAKFNWPLTKIMQKLKEGKPANHIEIQQIVFDLKTELANDGYPYSTVNYTFDTTAINNIVDITFYIQADSLVHFGNVQIEGINKYPEFVGIRELKLKTGEVYRRKAILDSQKRLFESGYFTFSQLTQSDSISDRLHPDFVLKVKERKPVFISTTAGAGQSELKDLLWDFNFGAGIRNVNFPKGKFFSGGSHRISVYADYSFTVPHRDKIELFTHRYRLRYTTPWTLGIRMPLSLTAEWEPSIQSQLGDYNIRKWSFSAKTQKWYGDEIFATAGLEYDNVKYSDFGPGFNTLANTVIDTLTGDTITIDELTILNDVSIRRKFFTTFRMDTRDNIFVPRVGQFTFFSAEVSGGILGGGDNYYKVEAAWSTYQPVWPGWIYAVRLKGGIAKEYGDSKEVPIDERLYLGGANTVRGFAETSLGPLQVIYDSTGVPIDTNVVGGNYSIIINNEFRWKTVQVLNVLPFGIGALFKKFPQWQSLFFDAGNGFKDSKEINLNQFAFSYGTGFQILSPAGPIRIDYARTLNTDRYDVDSRWHFTILYAF